MNATEDDECVYHLLLPTQAVMDTAGAQDTQKKDGERSIVVGVDSSFEGTPNKEGLIVTGIYIHVQFVMYYYCWGTYLLLFPIR